MMEEALENLNATPRPTQRGELTRQAERLVAQTFYGTLLKQMRDSPFRSELFEGGRGGQAFAAVFDQHLAERMSRGAGGRLVQSIVRQLEGAASTATTAPADAPRPSMPSAPNSFENVRIHVHPDLRS